MHQHMLNRWLAGKLSGTKVELSERRIDQASQTPLRALMPINEYVFDWGKVCQLLQNCVKSARSVQQKWALNVKCFIRNSN